MFRLCKIIIVYVLALTFGKLQSNVTTSWPLHSEKLITSNANLLNSVKVKNNRANFVTVNKQIVSPGTLINPDYAVGQFKKIEVKGLKAVLNWDMKVKFRLNRNINVVFSYN